MRHRVLPSRFRLTVRRATSGVLKNEFGTSLVEFALVSAFFMTVLFGIVGFGHALYAYHFVDHAAKEAIRYAVVRGSTCANDANGGSCQVSNSASGHAGPTFQADILTFVKSIAPPGIDPSQLNLTNVCGVAADPSGTPTAVACAESIPTFCTTTPNEPGCAVKVQVNYTFRFIVPLITLSSLPLSSSSEMVIAH